MALSTRVLWFVCVTMIWNVGARATCYLLVPVIGADLGLTPGEASLLVVVVSASYMLGFWALGRLQLARTSVIGGGMLVAMTAAAALQIVASFTWLLSVVAIMCFAIGAFYTNGLTLLWELSRPEQRSGHIALFEMSGAAAFALTAFVIARLIPWLAWRPILLLIVGGLGLLSLVLMLTIRRAANAVDLRAAPVDMLPSRPSRSLQATLMGGPRAWMRAVGTGLTGSGVLGWAVATSGNFTVVIALMGLMPVVLTQSMGQAPQAAALVDGTARTAGLLSPLLIAGLARRLGHTPVTVGASAVAGVMLLLLGALPYGTLFRAALGLMMLALVGLNTVMYTRMIDQHPADARRFVALALTLGKVVGELIMPLVLSGLFTGLGARAVFWATALVVFISGTKLLFLTREPLPTVNPGHAPGS